jgi:hypothetical protein
MGMIIKLNIHSFILILVLLSRLHHPLTTTTKSSWIWVLGTVACYNGFLAVLDTVAWEHGMKLFAT